MNLFAVVRRRIPAAPLLLALALLLSFAQLGGFVHALSHLTSAPDAAGGEKSIPSADACDACAGYSALGGPLAALAPALAHAPFVHARAIRLAARAARSRSPRRFRSRAPPVACA